MSDVLASLDVVRHDNGERRRLDLVDGFTPEHLECVEREWKPLLEGARDRSMVAFASLPETERNERVWLEKQQTYRILRTTSQLRWPTNLGTTAMGLQSKLFAANTALITNPPPV